jgi:hypothetical protein
MRTLFIAVVFSMGSLVAADVVTLRTGRQIQGAYAGGTTREIRMDVAGQIQTFQLDDVARIQFGAAQPSRNTSAELPAGTNLVVRMIDAVDSDVNRVGQTFAASLDEPVLVNGETVIPRGADVIVKLTDSRESGKLAGRAELTLDLVSVKVGSGMVDLNTETVSRESSSRGRRTAKVVGGGAALGAIIGAIAGGGKGAGIGAGAGAAAGAGAEVLTHGQRVRIPSETRLTFVLETTADIVQ